MKIYVKKDKVLKLLGEGKVYSKKDLLLREDDSNGGTDTITLSNDGEGVDKKTPPSEMANDIKNELPYNQVPNQWIFVKKWVLI